MDILEGVIAGYLVGWAFFFVHHTIGTMKRALTFVGE
jgi:hypothetical protein